MNEPGTTGQSRDRNADLLSLDVNVIDTNPYQPRRVFHEVALQELVASILEHGVLQPVIVRPNGNRYQLVSGERRLQATRRAGITHIPALVQRYDDRKMLEIAIVENVQREDISPLEAAEAYQRLMEEFSLTQAEVALRVGKSRPAISNTLRLLRLPPHIRESLARGDITEGHARSLLSISDPAWQDRAWRTIIEENLTVRDAEALCMDGPDPAERADRRVSRENRKKKRERKDPHLEALEDRLRTLLGTRVFINGTPYEGSIIVQYDDADDLQRLAELLGVV